MKPCFEALVANLDTFIASLQTEASVDIRLRLVGFRDLHDPTCEYGWDIHEFTENVAQFRSQLSKLEAKCGQKSRGAESSLDALFFAIHSDWRKSKTHRTIILITDDDAYDKLHASLYNRPDNGVERVIQDIQEMRHSMLFMVCPRFAIYRRIADSMVSADRKIAAVWVSNKDGETYQELANLNWASLLKMLGQSISKTSITVT
ncbi:hypothetical protein BSQ44_00580 [Aquibium oceanicum]|uniref:VWFA domain-containing protein n=2 Tax=Aquibium oceanicum TaxID=1670800 RepID=A0A1L3SKV7_9HYPH|nr:hypothetical protein BSQ44_00580 [Aquibium oceanicum]